MDLQKQRIVLTETIIDKILQLVDNAATMKELSQIPSKYL